MRSAHSRPANEAAEEQPVKQKGTQKSASFGKPKFQKEKAVQEGKDWSPLSNDLGEVRKGEGLELTTGLIFE